MESQNDLKLFLDNALVSHLIDKNPKLRHYTISLRYISLSPLKFHPIVLGINNLTQNINIYLDEILRFFVLSLPSYIRDTTDLLKKLEDITIDQDFYLFSIGVVLI